jgi:hypothetical protein
MDQTEQDGYDREVERVAAYLYRDEHGWSREANWAALSAGERKPYESRANAVAAMLGHPYHAKVVHQLARLCPCDPNPETTDGPQRDCPIHGEMPDAVIAIADAIRAVDRVRQIVDEWGKGLDPRAACAQIDIAVHTPYLDAVAPN